NHAAAAFAGVDPTPGDNVADAAVTAHNPAPLLSGLAVDKPVLWPPNHQLVKVRVAYGVADNCAGTVCSLSVTSNEPASRAGDWQVLGPHTVLLRAESSKHGHGRTYTVTATCVDSGQAVTSGEVAVRVPHDRSQPGSRP